jgi:adenylate cyclase
MEFLKKLFGGQTKPLLAVAEREISAFFASVDSYVGLSEQIPLPLLNVLMTAYFSECEKAIISEQGTLDKFIGDAAVAFFGAPKNQPDHALRACVAALKLQKRIAGLREKFSQDEAKWPDTARRIRVRIGINSGVAVVGNMGTAKHSSFTMMGDNVNLAARLENSAKIFVARIVCTGQTKAGCDTADKNRIIFRSLGKIVVKGRMDHVHLYEPMAFSSEATEEMRECINLFEQGLAQYREMDWDGAAAHFRESAAFEPHNTGIERNPSIAFLEMVERSRLNPPNPAFLP